jgi:TetR/AcrR family transcriptional regulator, regulator of autoinduction and epiphytic fitness
MVTSALPAPVTRDGRVLRGERNRRAVVEAMLALIEEGDPQPTAKRVAERAGVALRSVFHHFDDLESVLAAAARLQAQRHWHLVEPVRPDLPLGERVAQVVAQRSALFERIAPARRAALLVEHDSPVVRAWLEEGRATLRRQLAATFAPEVAGDGREVLAALDVSASWTTWESLRRRQGLSVGAARRVLTRMLTALVKEPR